MKLKPHKKGITDVDSWKMHCPPKEKDKHWQDGRSAKELAKYMTEYFPQLPYEIETTLLPFLPVDAALDWDAEKVTALPGVGEGRNHDAVLFHEDMLVTIEAKVDESLGKLVKEEMAGASVNKLHRISSLLNYLFKGGYNDYGDLRYQLLTASVGTLLEAQEKQVDAAVMLVVVFKSNGKKMKQENLDRNHADILRFLDAVGAYDANGCKVIPNNTNVKLYFREIII